MDLTTRANTLLAEIDRYEIKAAVFIAKGEPTFPDPEFELLFNEEQDLAIRCATWIDDWIAAGHPLVTSGKAQFIDAYVQRNLIG
jgi:hypothetical protein